MTTPTVQLIELVAIDFESTGSVSGYPAEPWQVGMVRMKGGRVDMDDRFESLIRVGDRPFNPHAPGRHHELRDEIAAAPELYDLWTELQGWWFNVPLVAHNIGTERKFITQAAPMHKVGPWIDTLKLSRMAYPNQPSHALEELLVNLNLIERVCSLCPGKAPHDAFFDAVACGVLLEHLLSLPGWENASLAALSSV